MKSAGKLCFTFITKLGTCVECLTIFGDGLYLHIWAPCRRPRLLGTEKTSWAEFRKRLSPRYDRTPLARQVCWRKGGCRLGAAASSDRGV